jgi:FKBP-type peptidyl-prolyl cis-trans isomerase FkpA
MRFCQTTIPLFVSIAICVGCNGGSAVNQEPPTRVAPPLQTGSSEPSPADTDDADPFTQTESGLKYRILRESTGQKPTASNKVVAHYRGWLDDGTEFDSSYTRGEPSEFSLGGVIPAWTEGLQLIGVGGKIELDVPPDLGYGKRGFPPKIPGNAQLHFIVELIAVR